MKCVSAIVLAAFCPAAEGFIIPYHAPRAAYPRSSNLAITNRRVFYFGLRMSSEQQASPTSEPPSGTAVPPSEQRVNASRLTTQLAVRQRFQELIRLTESLPGPIRFAAIAFVSGLLFFELARLLSVAAFPVLLMLGAFQSVKDKIDGKYQTPSFLDTEVVVDEAVVSNSTGNEQFDDLLKQRTKRLRAIKERLADAAGGIKSAMNTASSIRSKLASRINDLEESDEELSAKDPFR